MYKEAILDAVSMHELPSKWHSDVLEEAKNAAKKKKTSKKITARKMQQRKTYKKSMLKAAEDGFQRIVENLVLEAGVDVNTMVPII